jgi:hypothetical protein
MIARLVGDDRPLSRQKQHFDLSRQIADLVGGQQGTGDMLLSQCETGLFRVALRRNIGRWVWAHACKYRHKC